MTYAALDEIAAHLGTRNWVVARRTSGIVERYGEDVLCMSQARFRAMHASIVAART